MHDVLSANRGVVQIESAFDYNLLSSNRFDVPRLDVVYR